MSKATRIDLEDEGGWPEAVRDLLASRLPALTASLDTLPAVSARIDSLVASCDLVGFHCSRLTDDEVQDVRRNGLRALSPALVSDRLMRRVEAGDVDLDTAARIDATNRAKEPTRRDRVALYLRRAELRERHLTEPFFRMWGGEAVAFPLERDEARRAVLERIGTPCVVVVAVPVAAFEHEATPIGHRLAAVYLHRRGLDIGVGWASHLKGTIPAERVIGITTEGEAAFASLVGRSRAA